MFRLKKTRQWRVQKAVKNFSTVTVQQVILSRFHRNKYLLCIEIEQKI